MTSTPYRLQMKRHYPRQEADQRCHVESAISQHKRRLGACLSARTDTSRQAESYARVLTHNLMIL
jgi:transposase